MSRANEKLPIITSVEYFGKQERNESYKGYVVYPDGVVTMVLSEVVIKSQPLQIDVDEHYNMSLNKYTQYHLQTNIKYHEGMTPYVCEASSTRVHIQDYTLQVESTTKTEMVKRQVKEDLLRSMIYFYQDREFNKIEQDSFLSYTINHPSEIQIDVFAPRTQAQHDFAKLKQKIDGGTIKKRDFTSDLQYLLGKQIETYFACFDPKDPNYTKFWDTYHMGQATGFEAYIPVWSCVRNSVDAFQRAEAGDGISYYFDGIGYFSLALADVITIGMTTEVMMGAKGTTSMLTKVPQGAYNPAYFPTIRNGYGIFGENGLNFRNYKIGAIYQNSPKSGGGGTVFSIKQDTRGGNLFRLDYGAHNKKPPFWHYHFRYTYKGHKYGSSSPKSFKK